MQINIKNIIEMQSSLDKKIENKFNLKSKNIIIEKKIALIVEISEFLNVIQIFKYWKINKQIDKEKLLFEYVDCLHFILSLAIYYGLDEFNFTILEEKKDYLSLRKIVFDLLVNVNTLNSKEDIYDFINNFFSIAYSFDISIDEILDFYIKKNKINENRQKENY